MSFKPYPAYKDSGVEWLGQVPEGWGISKVNTGYEIQLGKMLQNNAQSTEDIQIPYLRAYNVAWEQIITDDIATMWANPREIEQYGINVGDLLVCEGGEAARCAILKKIESPTIIQNALHRVRPKKGFDNQFLMYYLIHCSSTGWFDVLCNKATIVHFTVDKFSNLELVLPPLPEQETIAAFLDHETARIDALIAAQHSLIALLKEKRQALISHAVTRGLDPTVKLKDSGVEWLGRVPEHWNVKTIAKSTTKITNGYVGPTRDILVESGVPYIQATHIKRGCINFDDGYFVTSEWSQSHSKSILANEDVLIVQTGAGTGDVGLVSQKESGYNCHALIILSSDKVQLRGSFLAVFLQSTYGKHKLEAIQTGAMHPHLNCGEVKFVEIPLPPLPEQEAIVAFLDSETAKIDTLVAEAEKGIELLKERRSALISAAVTGQIDLRDWRSPKAV